ncbi:hypothetical protein [Caudoviricetes sp.]|nr:hypothetical protein [Caudoviricetes sp.]UOF79138.1 hypothetical protein [Caudoviricetes sp.]
MSAGDGNEENKDSKLMVYFMGQTNERLTQIETKLIELIAFRAEVITEAKNKASNVALIYTVVGFIVTTATNIILRKMGI